MSQQLIDAHSLPQAVRNNSIFASFDALPVGDAFILVADQYPTDLLRRFQSERANQFEWNLLGATPRFRVRIAKRSDAAPREVMEYLSHDHRRLDALLDETVALFESKSLDGARQRFAEFMCGLDGHINAEELVLFSLFEAQAQSGPTTVMRGEHVRIREAMRGIATSLARDDSTGFHTAVGALESVLGEHNVKEEQVLYPMADSMVTDEERAELVRRMQATLP